MIARARRCTLARTLHMADNLKAGSGRLPDEPLRRRMVEYLRQI
jgi:hypothetical protein